MSDLLRRFVDRGLRDANSTMVIDDDHGKTSYGVVLQGARAVAHSLREIAPGERVAILVHPCADFLSAFFGILLAGGCVVVLSPIHPEPESRYFCDDAGVKTILFSAPLKELATAVGQGRTTVDVATLYSPPPKNGKEAREPESAPALQLYTSGTTGKPKGAVLTHRNIGIQQQLVGEAWGFSASDVLLHALPLHHMHGLAIALLTAIGSGAAARLRSSFDARAIWEEMKDATVFMGVPAMYHRLFVAFDAATDEERARWSANAKSLRLATSGSAALPVTIAERWRSITGTIPLERFGMTEIGVGITNALHTERFAGCVGLPLATVETRIVGDKNEDAEVGELWIRGPSVFAEYHQRPEETKAAFVPDSQGGEPWFRTGDTVTRDPNLPTRPFRILGRTSVDILKSGGYKLSALEIEEALREHSAVLEVAVVGIPDEAWGEKVVACVVLVSMLTCSAETLKAHVRERLAPYKVPKDVIFLPALPKNALGKVVKPQLKTQVEALVPSPTSKG
jgi:malonyl-CoA/methylmalonyl-CoA synthetase